MSATGKLRPATKARPCAVCQGDHKCSRTVDGLILCGRMSGPQPGFHCLGPSNDPTWTMYRLEGDQRPGDFRSPASTSEIQGNGLPKSKPDFGSQNQPLDFTLEAQKAQAALTPNLRDELARQLRLPSLALGLVPNLGYSTSHGGYTFPEFDAAGNAIGISVRRSDGSKRCVAGSRRGLFLTGGWASHDGPLFIVEGMSDALALAHVGLAAIGRPGAKAGGDLLVELLRQQPAERLVIVMIENDRKADGMWPGKEGAEFIAKYLRQRLKGRTICIASPPEDFKDAREWIASRLEGETPSTADAMLQLEIALGIGKDIAATLARLAKQAAGQRPAQSLAPFPVPLPITHLSNNGGGGVAWVWDGYLARGRVTLMAALPKCGKTTLLTHLLKALDTGGSFCGRPLFPGKAVVVTEEAPEEWAGRRDLLGLTDNIRVLPRPFFGKPSYEEWLGFITHLIGHLENDPADVVILDTLADLWSAKDENSAVEVHAALQPLRKLAENRAVVAVHHIRKSDGGEGTASRGSGALVGFVDVIMELRRAPKASDPHGCRRTLKAYGRMPGIPDEWMIELDPATQTYRHLDSDAAAVNAGADREDDRKAELKEAIRAVLPVEGEGMTREQVWNALPPQLRRNEVRFKQLLVEEAGVSWRKEGNGNRTGPFRYTRLNSESGVAA